MRSDDGKTGQVEVVREALPEADGWGVGTSAEQPGNETGVELIATAVGESGKP